MEKLIDLVKNIFESLVSNKNDKDDKNSNPLTILLYILIVFVFGINILHLKEVIIQNNLINLMTDISKNINTIDEVNRLQISNFIYEYFHNMNHEFDNKYFISIIIFTSVILSSIFIVWIVNPELINKKSKIKDKSSVKITGLENESLYKTDSILELKKEDIDNNKNT